MSGKLIATVIANSTVEIKYLGGGGVIDWVKTMDTATVAVDSSPNAGVNYVVEAAAINEVGNIVVNVGVPARLYKFTIADVGTTDIEFYASGNWDVENVVIT